MDTTSEFILGELLGLLGKDKPQGAPSGGEEFPKAWQLSLQGCGMRLFLGPFRGLVPSFMTTKPWQSGHQHIDFHVKRGLRSISNRELDPPHERESVIKMTMRQTNNEVQIRDQAIQTMMAAQNTLPRLLCNTIFCLSRHLEIWERLRAEVTSLGPEPLTVEEARKFKFLRNVLSECK